MKKNFPISGVEKPCCDDMVILSTTDLKGAVTYVNDDFIEMSGFSETELLHQNHNIVRHPEMPPAAFANLWDTLKQKKSWMGIVKNRCKNGDHYWVNAFVTPIKKHGTTTEFQSVRTSADRDDIARAEKLYDKLNQGKLPFALRLPRISIRNKLWLSLGFSLLPWFFAALSGLEQTGLSPFILLAVSVVIGGAGVFFSTRCLYKAVNVARDTIDNPVIQQVYTGTQDEGGNLLLALKMLKAEGHAIAGRIHDAAQHIRKNSDDLSNFVMLTSNGVNHQSDEISTLRSSAQELAQSAEQVLINAQQAAEKTNAANASAEQGMEVVASTINTIRDLATQVEDSAVIIRKLDEETQQIGSVLDVIMNIAEQTNLLALNAAIEAARAGEQGRGFAVVADEVRSLANRTHESTKEIEEKITRLQTEARAAVEEMTAGCDKANAAVEHAGLADGALQEITNAVAEIQEMNNRIAQSASEQTSQVSAINENVETVNEISELTVDTLEGQTKVSEKMAELSDFLHELAGQFLVLTPADKTENKSGPD